MNPGNESVPCNLGDHLGDTDWVGMAVVPWSVVGSLEFY
jgi:hypothetical protein